jgi:hypothetical protein
MKARLGSGTLTQNFTIRAIVDVIMAAFAEFSTSMDSATASSVSSALERFLSRQLSYDELAGTVASLVGVTQPLEKLRGILETGSDPIPTPVHNVQTTGGRRRSRAWTQYEDQRLLAGIYRNGIENWTSISKFVGNGRTRSQCSQRWYRGLDPKISKDQWSKDEEHKLLALVEEHGDKCWTTIASKLGNRSDVQCRYRYWQLQKDAHGAEIESTPEEHPHFLFPGPKPIQHFFAPPVVQFRSMPLMSPPAIQCPMPPMTPPPALAAEHRDEQRVQFHMPPVRQHSPMVSPAAIPSPVGIPFRIEPVPTAFQLVQSPMFCQVPKQQAPEPQEHHEPPRPRKHAITAPAFDGRLYSVY